MVCQKIIEVVVTKHVHKYTNQETKINKMIAYLKRKWHCLTNSSAYYAKLSDDQLRKKAEKLERTMSITFIVIGIGVAYMVLYITLGKDDVFLWTGIASLLPVFIAIYEQKAQARRIRSILATRRNAQN